MVYGPYEVKPKGWEAGKEPEYRREEGKFAPHELKYMRDLSVFLKSMRAFGQIDDAKVAEIAKRAARMVTELGGAAFAKERISGYPLLPFWGAISKGQTVQEYLLEFREKEAALQISRQGMLPTGRLKVKRPSPTYPMETPRYDVAFQEMATELEGTQPWKTWFESQYSGLLRQFKATLPEAGVYPTRKEAAAEQRGRQESWAEYLKRRKPELREEFWGLGAYRRGERPGAFQPRIRTVSF